MHPGLVHILLGEYLRQLLCAVVAEVEEYHHVALAYQADGLAVRTHGNNGFYEFVGYTLVVGGLDGRDHVGRGSPHTAHKGVVGHFYTLPTFIAIHGVVAAYHGGDCATGSFQMILQRFDITLTAFRVGVAAIHKAVDVCFILNSEHLCYVAQFQQMVERRVNPAVGDQAHEMHSHAFVARVLERLHHFRILHDGTVAAGAVDFHEVLVHDPSRADVEVSHLAVAHLSVGQTHVFAARKQFGVRVVRREGVDVFGMRLKNHVILFVVAVAPTVEDHQQHFFINLCTHILD